jgi:hypothetical protein
MSSMRIFILSFAFVSLLATVHAANPMLFSQINPNGFPKNSPEGGLNVVRIWYEKGHWNLRTSTEDSEGKKNRVTTFTGTVRSEDKMTATGSRLEAKADKFVMHADGKGFDFKFTTHGAQDTVEFTPGPRSKTLRFLLKVNNEPVEAARIIIGSESKCPDKNEFLLPAVPPK